MIKKHKRQTRIITIVIALCLCILISNKVRATISGGGATGNSGGTATNSGRWAYNKNGYVITVTSSQTNDPKTKNICAEEFVDNEVEFNNTRWITRNFGTNPDVLYEELGIPTSSANRDYSRLLSKIPANCKNKIVNGSYIYIEPYLTKGGQRYTLRSFSPSTNDINDGAALRALANSARVGIKVGLFEVASNILGLPSNGPCGHGSYNYDKWNKCQFKRLKYGYGILELKASDIPNLVPKKASIKIKKVDSSTNAGLSGAIFKVCTSKEDETTLGGTCKTVKTILNGVVTVNGLNPNTTYYIQEIEAPSGYELNSTIYKITTGSGGSTVYLDPVPNKKSCFTRLDEIKREYGFTVSTTNGNARKKLYELYEDFPDYNKLLNFDNYNDKGISCGTFQNTEISEVDKNSGSEMTCSEKLNLNMSNYKNKYFWYLSSDNSSGIKSGSSEVKCKYTINTSESRITNNISTFAGTSIWSTQQDADVFKIGIIKTCTGYNVSDTAKTVIENEMKNENFELELSLIGKSSYNGNEKTFSLELVGPSDGELNRVENGVEYEVSVEKVYAWKYGADNTIYYKKSDGSFVNNLSDTADKNNYIGPDYGFPTPIMSTEIIQQRKVYFTLILPSNITVFFGLGNTLSTECNYSTYTELIIPETKKLNLEFRIIDTDEPFPGKNGSGRSTGSNWCEDFSLSEARKEYNLCVANGGSNCESDFRATIAGVNETCNSNNDKVQTYITNRNNSYNKNNKAPLISVTLDSTSIKNIREYNQGKSYFDNSLTCRNGEKCKSSFVNRLLKNNYGQVTGSCDTSPNRDYCVGG